MWVGGKKGGGSGGASIEYVGEFRVTTSATTATSINFASGTYARSDYAELTADNFLVVPKRSSSNISATTPDRYRTNNTYYHAAVGTVGNKNHEYNASTGILKFYGGVTINSSYSSTSTGTLETKTTTNATITYKVYVVKPEISTFES